MIFRKAKLFKVYDTESLATSEGTVRPFFFGENVSLIHLEVPKGLEIPAHSHPREGILYCLAGELQVYSEDQLFKLSEAMALLVPPDVAVGIRNKSDVPAECLLISSPPALRSADELKERLKHYQIQKESDKNDGIDH